MTEYRIEPEESNWTIDRENATATHKVNDLVVQFVSLPLSANKARELDAAGKISVIECSNSSQNIKFGVVANEEDMLRIIKQINYVDEDPSKILVEMIGEAGQAWVNQFTED